MGLLVRFSVLSHCKMGDPKMSMEARERLLSKGAVGGDTSVPRGNHSHKNES